MAIPLQSSSFAPPEMSHCLSAAFHELEGANLRKSVLINNATLTATTLDSSAREASASCRVEKQGPLLPQNDEASFFDELLDELSDCSSSTLPRHRDAQSSMECQDDQSEHTLLVSMADTDTALNPHKVVAFSSSAPSLSCACDEVYCSETAHKDCKSDSCDDLPSLVADSQDDQSEHTLLVSMADTDTALNPHKVVAFSSSAPSLSCACDEVYCSETAHKDCKSDSCDDLPSLVADSQESIDDDCWEDVLDDAIEARPCHALETISNQTCKAPFHNLTRDCDQLSAAETSP